MGETVAFSLSLRLNPDLSPIEFAMLDHVLCGRGPEPREKPDHEVFQLDLDLYRFHDIYRELPLGAYMSDFWTWKNPAGRVMHRGVRLDLPGLSPDVALGPFVAFTDWLASLSISRGYVGAIAPEQGDQPPVLLFVREGRHGASLSVVGDYERDPMQRCARTGRPVPVW